MIPKEHYGNLLNHIKVQSRLRIDEHNSTQDGAMRYTFQRGILIFVFPLRQPSKEKNNNASSHELRTKSPIVRAGTFSRESRFFEKSISKAI